VIRLIRFSFKEERSKSPPPQIKNMIDSFKGRYSFLSNFYPVEIKYKGITYPSVEHYYVAQKIKSDQIINGTFYPVEDVKEMISKISTPGKVKVFGRGLNVRSDWDSVKLDVMEFGVRQKFKNVELSEMLLQTGDEDTIEGNWWHDNFWGSCSCQKCGNNGKNELGKLLMLIRSEIKGDRKRNTLEDVLFPK